MSINDRVARAQQKLSRIPIKIPETEHALTKPSWLKVRLPNNDVVQQLQQKIKSKDLVTVCEEANCPNIYECYQHGTATFMIMGEICTRRCSFCDVKHGRPNPLDENEPENLAKTIKSMQLKYVVITSVDRDDLKDGGANHFVRCIEEIRKTVPHIKIEILTPDFRGKHKVALDILKDHPPEVFNHNIETVPSLYKAVRPGASYIGSLELLQEFKRLTNNKVPTKSGIMLGLGETEAEIITTLADLRKYEVDMLTMGQYLQPTKHHYPVKEYISPEQFDKLGKIAEEMGFTNVASGPLVRSSYHADQQAKGA